MDGDPVTGKPSENRQPRSMTELFVAVFPQYLAMGMTYDEFWHKSPMLVKDYREAFEMRMRREEWARWRQGAYVYNALIMVAPVMRAAFGKGRVEPGKYPDEPWPLTEKEAKEREDARRIENYKRYLSRMEAESERELKRRAELEKKETREDV